MTGPPELLDVAAVMARYGLRDRRAARRLMDEAGAFVVAGKMLVRTADLVAHEDALRAARRPQEAPAPAPRVSGRTRGTATATRPRSEPRPPYWWRDGGLSADAAGA